jgi:hypothetical protein
LKKARANVSLGLTAIYRALGGGWQIREDSCFVTTATVEQMRARTRWEVCCRPSARRNHRLRDYPRQRTSARRSGARNGEAPRPALCARATALTLAHPAATPPS